MAATDVRADDLRAELLDRVDAIGPVLEAQAPLGDELGRLTPVTVAALREAGLHALKVPACLGGFEAEPALQYEVFERVAHYDIAAGWCLFIYADSAGMMGARLPDAGLAEVFRDGVVPICCGGGGLKPGSFTAVDGGLLLDGRWRYGSGIAGAEWVLVSALLAGEDGGRPRLLSCAVPTASLQIDDRWDVHGLRATGSVDFAAENLFVPMDRVFAPASLPLRGGRQYRNGAAGFLSYTVPAVCGAVTRRALRQVMDEAATRTRSYSRPAPLAGRGAFQRFCGEADLRLRAARALMLEDGEELMRAVDEQADLRAREAQTRAAAAYATEVAADVLAELVRHAGSGSLMQGSYLEKARRDVTMAAGHLLVDAGAYENHAQFMLGIPGADPLA